MCTAYVQFWLFMKLSDANCVLCVLQMAVYDELKRGFEAKCHQHMILSEQFRPSHIQTNLKVAILQAEEESENIMENFLNSECFKFSRISQN